MGVWWAMRGQLPKNIPSDVPTHEEIRCECQAGRVALRQSRAGGATVDVRGVASDIPGNSSRGLSDEVRRLHDRGAEARLRGCILADSDPAQQQIQSAPSIR